MNQCVRIYFLALFLLRFTDLYYYYSSSYNLNSKYNLHLRMQRDLELAGSESMAEHVSRTFKSHFTIQGQMAEREHCQLGFGPQI